MEENGTVEAVLSFVYAKCSIVDRRELWQQLHVLSQTISMPWMIGGDFNTILYANEREATLRRYVPWTISMKPYL